MTALSDAAGEPEADARSDPDASTSGRPTAARFAAAAAVRRVGHALVSHDLDDPTLARLTSDLQALAVVAEAAPTRVRAPFDFTSDGFGRAPAGGGGRSTFADSFVSGKANPMGLAADVALDGDDGVLTVTLGPAFEGAPGRAHGGALAALFDEVMGFVLSNYATAAYTGRLAVTYRAPTPLGVELELRVRVRSRHGRKLRIEGEARHGDALIAEAEGLFIAVDPERFARGEAQGPGVTPTP